MTRLILVLLWVTGMAMASAKAQEAPGASAAFTSKDPTVVKAVALLKEGKLKDGEEVIAAAPESSDADVTRARDESTEIIRRTRREYSQSSNEVLAMVKRSVPDATAEDLARWTKAGEANARVIDGETKYFNREPSNLFKFCTDAKDRRAKAGNAPKPEDKRWSVLDHLKQVVEAGKKSDTPEVLPIKHRITYTITIPANSRDVKPGSIVKVWLPFPQEYRQQRDVKLVESSPHDVTIAPSGIEGFPISAGAQRTVYFEKKVEDPSKAMTFKEVFVYTSFAYYPKLDDNNVEPLPADWNGKWLSERLPHISFTPEIRKEVATIVGDETNPLKKARKIFHWVSANIPWHAEEEYTIISSFAEKCFAMRKGDCGVQSTMFVTLCRIAGVPARWQSGWQTKPIAWNMHDWSEIYVRPWGWLPVDASNGVQESDDPELRDFYFGHQDSYRMIVNLDYGRDLIPPKLSIRSEPADFQRGEVEVDGKNFYFDQWKYDIQFHRDPAPNFDP